MKKWEGAGCAQRKVERSREGRVGSETRAGALRAGVGTVRLRTAGAWARAAAVEMENVFHEIFLRWN